MAATEQPEQDPRIYFAAERTLLAWIRTGMAMMAFGFVVARFGLFLARVAVLEGLSVPTSGSPRWFGARWFGASMVMLGVLMTIGALLVHLRTVQRLKRGEPYVGQQAWLAVATAAFLAAGGVVLTLYLLAFSS